MPFSRRILRGIIPGEEAHMAEVDAIRELLRRSKTVVVVGCSANPGRDSHRVAAYLQRVGYRMIPVNPGLDEVLGEKCFPDLASIPTDVTLDIVDVFRRAEHVPPIVEAAIGCGAGAIWLQLGVTHPEAERRAAEAGLQVVSDRCIKIEHSARFG
jgi:predicted CoA-binding protein